MNMSASISRNAVEPEALEKPLIGFDAQDREVAFAGPSGEDGFDIPMAEGGLPFAARPSRHDARDSDGRQAPGREAGFFGPAHFEKRLRV